VAPEYAWNDYAPLSITARPLVVGNDPGYQARDPKNLQVLRMTITDAGPTIRKGARQASAGVLRFTMRVDRVKVWSVVHKAHGRSASRTFRRDYAVGRRATMVGFRGWRRRALFAAAGLDCEATSRAAARAGVNRFQWASHRMPACITAFADQLRHCDVRNNCVPGRTM